MRRLKIVYILFIKKKKTLTRYETYQELIINVDQALDILGHWEWKFDKLDNHSFGPANY